MADTGKMKIAPAPHVNGGITALVGVFFSGYRQKAANQPAKKLSTAKSLRGLLLLMQAAGMWLAAEIQFRSGRDETFCPTILKLKF